MQKWPTLLLLGMLAACKPPDAANPAPADAPASTPAPQGIADAAEASPEERLDVAIDEPLPPFEDDSGISLISSSALQALEPQLQISGTVLVYEAPDGSHLLRLENLSTPKDIHLDLALGHAERGPQRVAPLKGPSGNMNYLLDAAVNLGAVQAFVLVDAASQRVVASAPRSRP